MASPIFRKVALEKLSTPEQLDQLVQVTTPRGWLALAALAAAILVAAFWSVRGAIPTTVRGNGVIVRTGGTFNVVATNAGRIVELHIPDDFVVAKGQVLARVAQPELAAQVAVAQGDLSDLVAQRDAVRRDLAINAAKRRLAALEERLARAETIVSPIDGHILSLQAAVGDLVGVGSVLCNVELGRSDLVATVYVSSFDGKKIAPGSYVQLSPAEVKQEEYGTMVGRARRVSRFPTTAAEMMYHLQNESLVKLFSSEGAPFAVEVELLRDASTPSGFRWSSGKGPAVTITSGTVCTARIVVAERRPIDLVIPYLRANLGI